MTLHALDTTPGNVLEVFPAGITFSAGRQRDIGVRVGSLEGTSKVRGQPRTNTFWHSEKLLRAEGDDDEAEDDQE
jgi:hypothetical protein